MAETISPRFGFRLPGLGTDPWPGRGGWRTMLESIENGSAKFLQGTLAARPAASLVGRFYAVTSGTGVGGVYYDTGSTWLVVGAVAAQSTITASSPSVPALTVTGTTSQSAPLQEWRAVSGAVVSSMDAAGRLSIIAGSAGGHAVTKAQLDAVAATVKTTLNSMTATAAVSLNNQKITNLADGSSTLDAVNKRQLDAVSASIPQSLSAMPVLPSAPVNMGGQRITNISGGSAPTDAASRAQIDALWNAIPDRLNVMPQLPTGPVNMGGQRVALVAWPTDGGDAASKVYVDETVNNMGSWLATSINGLQARFTANPYKITFELHSGGSKIRDYTPGMAENNLTASVVNGVTFLSGWFQLDATAIQNINANRLTIRWPNLKSDEVFVSAAAFFDRSTGDWFMGHNVMTGSTANSHLVGSGVNVTPGLWVANVGSSGRMVQVTDTAPFTWAVGDVVYIGGSIVQ